MGVKSNPRAGGRCRQNRIYHARLRTGVGPGRKRFRPRELYGRELQTETGF